MEAPAANIAPLRTMCQSGYPSKFNPDSKEKPGVAIEMTHALERLDKGIRVTGYENCAATARMFSELEKSQIDVLFAVARNPEREAQGVFINPPLYRTYQKLVVRADDKVNVKDLDDVRKLGKEGVILVASGSAQARFLKAEGEGLHIEDGSSSNEQNLSKLVAGRGRFFYSSDMGIGHDVASLKLADKVRVLPPVFQPEDVYVIFSKKTPKTVIARIQAALEKLKKSGELDRIHARYLK
jgi:polar amino acid transport system substrate-binding protein